MMKKYLSKSIFKNALTCRTKLYYAANNVYKNNQIEDKFLKSIAEGGFQVGELAKCYYPNGIEISSELTVEENFEQTKELLKKKNVVIFEGVIIYKNAMARFDILEKKGNIIRLIEVKSKSFSGSEHCDEFLTFKNKEICIKSDWIDISYDITYQKWILSKVYPNAFIESYLMLPNKNKVATVDNLNQKFLLVKNDAGQTVVKINGDVSLTSLGERILSEICVNEIVNIIENHNYTEDKTFDEWMLFLMDNYEKNEKLTTKLGKKCGDCQFTCTLEEEQIGLKNGKNECWSSDKLIGADGLDKPTVLDIWNYRSKDKKIAAGIMLMEKVSLTEFIPSIKTPEELSKFFSILDRELSDKERQALQIWKTTNRDNSIFVNKDCLKKEMESWVFPLHMIDFETTSVAIPLHIGMRPYEGIAFQFSHHIIHEDGRIEHAGEYINKEIGHFPNFDFVRELKKQLSNDSGTIFKYSQHENSYLNMILIQLFKTPISELSDRNELITFIKSITHKSVSAGYSTLDFEVEDWVGERDMVDLLEIIKKYYYNPHSGGSNSIKHILPAILKSSDYLKAKYCQPIYGTSSIPSKNFSSQIWITQDADGEVVDPYKQLPNAFDGISKDVVDTFITADKISDGGAAMTAYAKIQFSEMNDLERNSVISALLKYCELDTFAMVMLYEHFAELVYNIKYKQPITKEDINNGRVENLIKLDCMSLYGNCDNFQVNFDKPSTPTNMKKQSKNEEWVQPQIEFCELATVVKPKPTVRIKRSGKKIQTERWIIRFRKDSTDQLILKLNSPHYNLHQKRIIREILEKRSYATIESEIIVNRLKKNSTAKLMKLLNSQQCDFFKKNVINEILLIRKGKKC